MQKGIDLLGCHMSPRAASMTTWSALAYFKHYLMCLRALTVKPESTIKHACLYLTFDLPFMTQAPYECVEAAHETSIREDTLAGGSHSVHDERM